MIVAEKETKSILSKSNLPVADYSVNPYVGCEHGCRYCYASFMKRFANHPEPWGDSVDVKFWPPIKKPEKYAGKELFIGSVTDPYQPLEEKYGRTRALLEEMVGSGCDISIATRSDLVVRDIDLIKQFPNARVSFSLNTLDDSFQAAMDNAPSIDRRIKAMRTLHDAGIRTTCFISPIFPGIADPQEIILATRDACNLVWLENLNLRGGYKQAILDWIAENRPDLMGLYSAIYHHGDRTYWHELDEQMREFCADQGLEYLRDTDDVFRPFDAAPVVVNYFFHEEVKKSAKSK